MGLRTMDQCGGSFLVECVLVTLVPSDRGDRSGVEQSWRYSGVTSGVVDSGRRSVSGDI